MRRSALIALAAIAMALPAAAQNQRIAAISGVGSAETQAMVVHSYGLTPNRISTKEAMAELKRICASKRHADQSHCDSAWKRINAEYARKQAEKLRG